MNSYPPGNNKENEKGQLKQILEASQVGIQLVLSSVVGLAIGYFLDKFLHTSPFLTLIFFGLGIASGFIQLFRTVRKQLGNGNDKKNS